MRPIKESGLEVFGQWLSTHQWTAVENSTTLDEKLENFTQTINDEIDVHFPKLTAKFHAEDKPFITGKIKNLILKRERAYTKSDQRDYKRLRNKVSEEIKKAKKTFYAKKIRPLRSNDPKFWWSTIKKICSSSKNQQIFLTNPENGEPLTSSESAKEINN